MSEELPVFSAWIDFLEWLLPTTEKFPKKVRFTLVQRIDDLALAIVEDLVEARYSRDNSRMLARTNIKLEKLRVLLRLSYRLQHLPSRQYRHPMRQLHAIGSMVGGWRKYRTSAG